MRSLANNLLILALLLATPALAQDLPPDRVGRVSIVSGRLAFYRTGEPDWSEAKVNLPVIAGGWFATDPRSRAQLRIGPESINLAEDSQVNIVELHQKVTQLALTRGRVNLHLRRLERDETAEIDITRGGIWLLQPGIYDIESGGSIVRAG